MKISKLETVLASLIDAKRTVCLEGSPGIGKTTVPIQIARSKGLEVQVIHLPTARVEDFGIPMIVDGNVKFSIPEWFPCKGSKHAPKGLLIFDDRNQADTNLQKVLANIVQARELNGHKLLDGWSVISTGNRCSDRSGAVRVLAHLRNRETVLNVDVDLDSWTDWAVQNKVNPNVVAFLQNMPKHLNNFDAKNDINATPRAWVEGIGNILDLWEKEDTKISDADRLEVFEGSVGKGPATEFNAYLRLKDSLPDFDKILKNPELFNPTANRPDIMYAIAVHLSYKATPENMENVAKVMDKLRKEYQVLVMRLIVKRIQNTDEYKTLTKVKGFLRHLKEHSASII